MNKLEKYSKLKKKFIKFNKKENFDWDYFYLLQTIYKKLTLMGVYIWEDNRILEKKSIAHTIWEARFYLSKVLNETKLLDKRIAWIKNRVLNKFGFYLESQFTLMMDETCSKQCNTCEYKDLCNTNKLESFYFAVDKDNNILDNISDEKMLEVYDYQSKFDRFEIDYEKDTKYYFNKFLNSMKENIWSWWD